MILNVIAPSAVFSRAHSSASVILKSYFLFDVISYELRDFYLCCFSLHKTFI